MKKLLIGMISFFSVSCYSQTVYINGGISHSKLDLTYRAFNDEETKYEDALLGSSFFIGDEYLKQKNFSLSTEIGIYQAGGQYSSEELNKHMMFNSPSILRFKYFSINTCFNFNPLNKKFKLQFQAGPKLDFLIKKNDSIFSGNVQFGGLYRNVFGFITGLGIYYQLNKIQFGINGKYIIGEQKISKWIQIDRYGSTNYEGIQASHSTCIFNLSVGYNFKYTMHGHK